VFERALDRKWVFDKAEVLYDHHGLDQELPN